MQVREAADRAFPAAVVDPQRDAAETISKAVRLVPVDAERIDLGQIRLGYRHRSARPQRWSRDAQNRCDVERAILRCHGGRCETDAARAYLEVAVHEIARQVIARPGPKDVVDDIWDRAKEWARRWTPGVAASADDLISEAARRPRRFSADAAARKLGLTMADRMAARVTTIGAVDCDYKARIEARKERNRVAQQKRDTAARRAAGKPTREEWLWNSVKARCARAGISPSAYYRRLKAGLPTGVEEPAAPAQYRDSEERNALSGKQGGDSAGQTTCVTRSTEAAREIAAAIRWTCPMPSGFVATASTREGRLNRIAQVAMRFLGYGESDRIDGEYPDKALLSRMSRREILDLEERCQEKKLKQWTVAQVAMTLGVPPAVRP